jgi:hypothetical protein
VLAAKLPELLSEGRTPIVPYFVKLFENVVNIPAVIFMATIHTQD